MIANQAAALEELGIDYLILSAGPAPEHLPHCEVPALGYLSEPSKDPADLYAILRKACQKHFGNLPDLWHLHNATLGKNLLFPSLVRELATSRTPLLLQLHDLAEDNRPANYPRLTGDLIYPVAPHVHYAFINSRDQKLFQEAGLPPSHSHLLPNAVTTTALTSEQDLAPREHPLVLYPVRGIRRKNLGEMALLAALAPAGTRFATSLAPENREWQDIHNRWQDFANENNLAIEFNVTDRIPPHEHLQSTYSCWLHAATHILTTSIAEGFGLSFLEPALQGKPLLGRDLPEITSDFRSQGIEPGNLYQRIPIPLEALDQDFLNGSLRTALIRNYQRYETTFHEHYPIQAWENLVTEGHLDFGNLPEATQEEIILAALAGKAPYLLSLQEWLQDALAEKTPALRTNDLSSYSLERSQENLLKIYQIAFSSTPKPPSWLDKKKVLQGYLSPERFHFLRT